MAAPRSIASLPLGFGLVSIQVRLYTATESSSVIHFNMLSKEGSRVKQQYVAANNPKKIVPRAEMVRGYEFEQDRFVIFKPEELKALEEGASHLIDIVAFIPANAVDPICYGKPYFLAPDKRGGKPYNLLEKAMLESGRCALAKLAWKSKKYVVQVRAEEDGLVLQQLLYAEDARSLKDLNIEKLEPLFSGVEVGAAADRPDCAGGIRPDDVRGRGKEAHPRGDRCEDCRRRNHRDRAPRGRRLGPGHRHHPNADGQPGEAVQPRREKTANCAGGLESGGHADPAPRCKGAARTQSGGADKENTSRAREDEAVTGVKAPQPRRCAL